MGRDRNLFATQDRVKQGNLIIMLKNPSKKQAVISSLLDKLVDEDPEKKHETNKSHHQQLTAFYQSVRRDLESLLNTRSPRLQWPDHWQELNTSLAAYGVPDFMSGVSLTAESQNKFCKNLASIIQRFDPRFKNVQVQLLPLDEKQNRTLRLRIEGFLYAEPAPEPVVFDSMLEPELSYFSIGEGFML